MGEDGGGHVRAIDLSEQGAVGKKPLIGLVVALGVVEKATREEVKPHQGRDVNVEVAAETSTDPLLQGLQSVSYTHLRSPRDLTTSRMPSSA